MKIIQIDSNKPYKIFYNFYKKAEMHNQVPIEAISISSFNKTTNEVQSRYVNLKYIIGNKWIFFSNYNSPKAKSFESHNQITALIYWDKINVQIRMKAKIAKADSNLSDNHFTIRSKEKNIIAILSKQSQEIKSYEYFEKQYDEYQKDNNIFNVRPDYWGGFSFVPYYFEFWEGAETRMNKRHIFELNSNTWEEKFLQP